MAPSQAEAELRKRLVEPLGCLTPRHGIDAMIAFYMEQRAEGVAIEEDGDMLLLQWGTYGFSAPPTFQINITRQFIVSGEDEPHQLSLTFHYADSAATKALKPGNQWCSSTGDAGKFGAFVGQSKAMTLVQDMPPLRVELRFFQC